MANVDKFFAKKDRFLANIDKFWAIKGQDLVNNLRFSFRLKHACFFSSFFVKAPINHAFINIIVVFRDELYNEKNSWMIMISQKKRQGEELKKNLQKSTKKVKKKQSKKPQEYEER